jgi:Phytanoyl-CoA dioxygenase (PhyH)
MFRSAVSTSRTRAILAELVETDRPGMRAFELAPALAQLIAADGEMTATARRLIGPDARPVRALIFDKSPRSNWALGWHQDRTIAVTERLQAAGFTNWSMKGGVPHAEPPTSILQAMVTLRLFLDECGPDKGPLEIALGSHALGKVPHGRVKESVAQHRVFTATGRAGDMLAMRLLLLHASGRSTSVAQRRVFHVDFSADDLPEGLIWAMAR